MTKPANNSNHEHMLLRTNLKLLRLPTISSEFEKLAREAAAANQSFERCVWPIWRLRPGRPMPSRFGSRTRRSR